MLVSLVICKLHGDSSGHHTHLPLPRGVFAIKEVSSMRLARKISPFHGLQHGDSEGKACLLRLDLRAASHLQSTCSIRVIAHPSLNGYTKKTEKLLIQPMQW